MKGEEVLWLESNNVKGANGLRVNIGDEKLRPAHLRSLSVGFFDRICSMNGESMSGHSSSGEFVTPGINEETINFWCIFVQENILVVFLCLPHCQSFTVVTGLLTRYFKVNKQEFSQNLV